MMDPKANEQALPPLPINEYGYAMCRRADGRLVQGPTAWGTPTSVNIQVACPPGASLIGLYHTHPGGVSTPSAQDVKSARDVQAGFLCIRSEREGQRCFRVRSR